MSEAVRGSCRCADADGGQRAASWGCLYGYVGLEITDIHVLLSSCVWLLSRAHPPSLLSPLSCTQFPIIDTKEGPYLNRGSCIFSHTSGMCVGTSRSGWQ